MAVNFRAGRAQDQKISRGQLLIGELGGTTWRNVGNVVVERTLTIETVDILTAEDPRLARLAKVTTKANEDLKITAKSFNALIKALAYASPRGEVWTQAAIANGVAHIPAGTKDGDIIDFVDANGKQVFHVTVAPADAIAANVNVVGKAGSFEVIGDRAADETLAFSCEAVTPDAKLGLFRRLQDVEIRVRARFLENNAFGDPDVHDWPVLSIRATGGQKLSDEGNDVQSIELDAAVEYDNTALGTERGTVRALG